MIEQQKETIRTQAAAMKTQAAALKTQRAQIRQLTREVREVQVALKAGGTGQKAVRTVKANVVKE